MSIANRLKLFGRRALGGLFALAIDRAQANEPADHAAYGSAIAPSPTPATYRGSVQAPITAPIFSDFESFRRARSASALAGIQWPARNKAKS
jgi:hypothetical protein